MSVTLDATELVVDGDMELSGTTNWLADCGTVAKNTTTPINGRQDLYVSGPGDATGVYHGISYTPGVWYRLSTKIKIGSSGYVKALLQTASDESFAAALHVNPATATSYQGSGLCLNTASSLLYLYCDGGAADGYFDDVSIKKIVNASLFNHQVNSGSSDVTEASVEVTVAPSPTWAAPAGVAICMDANDPTKYIVGYIVVVNPYGDYRAKLIAVNGTSVTRYYSGYLPSYVAGALVKLTKSGDSVSMYYDNSLVTTQTITGYTTQTIHSVFNADDGNTLGAYTLPSDPSGVTIDGQILSSWNGVSVSGVI